MFFFVMATIIRWILGPPISIISIYIPYIILYVYRFDRPGRYDDDQTPPRRPLVVKIQKSEKKKKKVIVHRMTEKSAWEFEDHATKTIQGII